jgi:hypothetical protein
MSEKDFTGPYDENELAELSEGEGQEHGGTWTVTVPISLAVCPTTSCTGDC